MILIFFAFIRHAPHAAIDGRFFISSLHFAADAAATLSDISRCAMAPVSIFSYCRHDFRRAY
jgi:hypothetical protein